MNGTDLLTVRQLQQLLKVNRITIYRMLGAGRLPGFKVGGQWRFSRHAIENWLQEQQADLGSPPPRVGGEPSPSADALPLSCIRAIQEILGQALGVGAVTTRLDGVPLTAVANCSPFCSLVLGSAKGARRCAESWRSWASGPKGLLPPPVCHAGLRYARSRIEVQGTLIAAVHAGQFLERPPADGEWLNPIRKLAVDCDLDEVELRLALEQVPVLDQSAQERLVRLLKKTAATFSEMGEERLSLMGRLQRIAEITRF